MSEKYNSINECANYLLDVNTHHYNKTSIQARLSYLLYRLTEGSLFDELICKIENTNNPNYYSTDINFANKLEEFRYLNKNDGLFKWDLLHEIETRIKRDFEDQFNFHNYNKLKGSNLLNILFNFHTNFRGNIVDIYKVKKYIIIETVKGQENYFYSTTNISYCWGTFEQAMVYAMCPKYSSAIIKLMED